ncbi:MAG: histidine kinase, partial [Chitinophagaceae bacterium]|nr:histidine kinase [Chitinophagaceae bacterium]
KESVADDQTKGAFAAMNYEQHIELLNNENLLAEQQLKNESLLRKILFFVIVAIIIVSVLIIGNILLKRKNEKLLNDHRQAEFQQKTAALEMEALRSQMNPHFIFNCLNAINRFILKNEPEAAAEYLAQFSKLIRMVLHHSKQATIQLDDEIEMLKLYLQMESLRFKNAFDYKLIIEPGTETDGLFVPPLLLQPFLENAIWHGLMHKKDKGEVTIHFVVVDNMLKCTIEDNGVGRIAANDLKSKQSHQYSSVGLQITRDRLALINGMVDGEHVTFTIDDLYDAEGNATGTRVVVNIKLNTGIEQQLIKRHSKSFI